VHASFRARAETHLLTDDVLDHMLAVVANAGRGQTDVPAPSVEGWCRDGHVRRAAMAAGATVHLPKELS
jgi:hypothetical protein